MFKKTKLLALFTSLVILALLLFVGCQEPKEEIKDDPDPVIVDPTLSFEQTAFELEIGEEKTIIPVIGQTTAALTVEYEVAKPAVCEVNNHVIKALAAGETTITAKLTAYPLITATISVRVFPFALTLTGSDEVFVGEEISLTATDRNKPDNIVVWESLNPNIATVDQNGKVTGHASGLATIRISSTVSKATLEKNIIVKDRPFALTLTGSDEVFVGEEITLIGTDDNNPDNIVFWESLDPHIATVDQNGKVTGQASGLVTIRISSFVSTETLEKTITVLVPAPVAIEVNAKTAGPYKSFGNVTLKHQVLPSGADQSVTWLSSNPEIATVDAQGKVSFLKIGEVEITAISQVNNSIIGAITMNIEVDPVALIKSLNVTNPIVKYVTTYGNTEKQQWVYGSVSKYYPGELNLKENIIAITPTIDGQPNAYIGLSYTSAIRAATEFKTVRSGVLKTAISDIIYHDTGNNNVGANADMHAKYIVGSANFNTYRARSWHYTVDDKEVIQHLPDNEVAWQGDTELAYSTTIGVETCVDFGSDLYTTWHRTAKLMAWLMQKHNLKITNIKQHYDYSQKECPQTLRRNNLYPNAIELIKAEYEVLTQLAGYTITFQSNNPEYVNHYGRIINLPSVSTPITYTVRITNSQGYDATVMLISILPAKPA
ncbi:MAG TPA: Ig-like domain-containing protein [Bacilli bacterium]|nr:MAG: N-acetylmuramoyl-L-alanine amidase CwlH precursor [Tenericutes bacterium ADurb.BinA124]HNZ50185.1 Ig-like domain-containing protein [Bacilli bacterium]HPX84388.1 Ig-like domain-containing protein [Bacilli bacterium]